MSVEGAPATRTEQSFRLGAQRLSLADAVDVAVRRRRVTMDDDPAGAAHVRMRASADWVAGRVEDLASGSADAAQPVYGINTGFGSLAGRAAFDTPELAHDLSRRLITSTSFGYGEFLDEPLVRAAMLIRAHSLAQGYSGVRPELVSALADALNADLYPAIPAFGSLGASGDLIPLSHLALVLTRPDEPEDRPEESGEAFLRVAARNGASRLVKVTGLEAMRVAGLERIPLRAKEGLALNNGTAFSTALTALALHRAERLVRNAEVASAATTDAVEGFRDAFLPEIHAARGHRGQIDSAANTLACLADSRVVQGDADADPVRQPPQDAYSIRCAPQVHGAVRDALSYVRGVVETELNAATDNPLIFPDLPPQRQLKAVSGGNFHAEPLAFGSDLLAIVATEVASLAERRTFRLTDGALNRGLPDMLIDSGVVGLDCGYMLGQYLAAALVSSCKTLAHPDSVDSIPTCANQEDHVSMAMNAGLHALQVVERAEVVVAIELLMDAQALELRASRLAEDGAAPDLSPFGAGARAVHATVRGLRTEQDEPVAHIDRDRVMYPYLRSVVELVRAGVLLEDLEAMGVSLR